MVSLRDQILADFAALRVPLSGEQLDEVLRTTEQQALSHLEFLQRLVGTQAQQRRQRAVERRIHDAYFREVKLLEDFDWKFNAAAIDRAQIEQLATGEFVRRGDNLVFVGQSGVGKSHLVQDLTAALADQTLPARLSYWTRFEWLIIDEFGFDRLERTLSPQAANLLYKVIDGRSPQRNALLAMPLADLLPIDYAALRAQVPMSQVLELLAFRPMRVRGPQLRGPCPLPNCPPVWPPRFSVNVQRHLYQCFACGSAGNQLDLWAAAHQLSLPAAAVHLCHATQTPVPRRLAPSSDRPSPRSATN